MIKQIHKVSKILFLIYILLSLIISIAFWNRPSSPDDFIIMSVSTIIFTLLVWIDAFRVLGKIKAFWFITIAALISFTSEYLGVNLGSTFGGAYHYNPAMGFMVGGVPIIVLMMWTAVVYICYRIAVIFAGKKIKFKNTYERVVEYMAIALVAGLAAVSWDLIWDPLAVKISSWTWHVPGAYFGIPTNNFIGWIAVVLLSCFIFEIVFKLKRNETKDVTIPFLGYFYLLLSTIFLALRLSEPHFAVIAFILMSPYLLVLLLEEAKRE